jgi:hypothetical protein
MGAVDKCVELVPGILFVTVLIDSLKGFPAVFSLSRHKSASLQVKYVAFVLQPTSK